MCGIVGYNGKKQAVPILIDSLKRLVDRGYDSAGIAVFDNTSIKVYKNKGRIAELENGIHDITGTAGIGHTRWAALGRQNKASVHPHVSGDIAVVYDGIIENYQALKNKLIKSGYTFVSETDTEVLAHLINHYFKNDLKEAVMSALKHVTGSYAIAVLRRYELIAARKDSPLVVGLGSCGNFVASDIPSLLKYTRKFIFMDDMEIACVSPDEVLFFDIDNNPVEKEVMIIDWDMEAAEKSGYEHFMLKEIHEQPQSIHEAFAGRISELEGKIIFEDLGLSGKQVKELSWISIIACGTSLNAGLFGKYLFEHLAGIHVDVEIASEFRYAHSPPASLVIAISQSGETEDTLAALRHAKSYGSRTIAVTNVTGGTITREVNGVVYLRSGPEKGVAATKTFTSQLIVLYLLALYFGKLNGKISTDQIKHILSSLKKIPAQVTRILENRELVKECAQNFASSNNFFFIGRSFNYPIALEGALKLKKLSYIHAQGYAAGELKHDPLALITDKTPVVAIATRSLAYDKIISNIREVKARGAPVIAIADENDSEIEKYVDVVLRVPSTDELLAPLLSSVIVQLLSYYMARARNCSIDLPGNLAKKRECGMMVE